MGVYADFISEFDVLEREYEEAVENLTDTFQDSCDALEEKLEKYQAVCNHDWRRPENLPEAYVGIDMCIECGKSRR
tara:strand:+ start:546 stop:773 length:228 start_codon:yes stop_codon:yes gene_type:complete